MKKLAMLIRWEFIRYGYLTMVHVEDIAKYVGCSEATVLRITRDFKLRRPGGKRVRKKRRVTFNHTTGPRVKSIGNRESRQRGAIASAMAQRETAPITLAGPHWSVPLREGVRHSSNLRLPSNPKRALADMHAELGRGRG